MTVPVLVENERTKLLANALDRASTACLAIGIFAPLVALIQGQIVPTVHVTGSLGGWLAAAIMLHIAAQQVLGRLKP